MLLFVFAFAFVLAAVLPAVASDQSDVAATVQQFVSALNNSDMAALAATCASPAAIIDQFPPYAWQGASGCGDWARDYLAFTKAAQIHKSVLTLGKPSHSDITGSNAYFSAVGKITFPEKPGLELPSSLTVVLQKGAAGWKITALRFATGG